jgi:type IX secretion system substrate protein
LGDPSYAGSWINNTVYYVPITFYDIDYGYYSYTNTTLPCYEMGLPFAVQYLTEVVSSNPIENYLDSSFTITINGGLPELDNSTFSASNLLPVTANFVNTTTNNGGTVQINGLQNGDMYSFDVADTNGCLITISGGPFANLPQAYAGYNTIVCVDLDTFQLGGSPTALGGIAPYTYVWETSYTIGSNTFYASTFLNDSTLANPLLISPLSNLETLTFIVTVTDSLMNTTLDSITILFSRFFYLLGDNFATINSGDSVQLLHSIGGGIPPYTYLWTPNYNLNTFTDEFPWAKPDTTTYYTCTVTDSVGCYTNDGDVFEVYVNPLGITSSVLNEKFNVYPNPFNKTLSIDFNLHKSSEVEIFITDLIGNKITTLLNQELKSGENSIQWIPENISSGIYFLNIKINDSIQVKKVVLNR